ncbi:MAG TPA: DUF6252 family protein [Longimicrobium sp.]|nr:DUF6252 family protein [Longimicrobium sp.]
MPRAKLLAALLSAGVVFGLGACKDGPTEPIGAEASFHAVWNGREWEGQADAVLRSWPSALDTLYVVGWRRTGSEEEEYVLVKVPYTGPGTYVLGPGSARMSYIVGGDALAAEYETGAEGAGTLRIQTAAAETITGEVQFHAAAKPGARPAGATAAFVGEFTAPLALDPN